MNADVDISGDLVIRGNLAVFQNRNTTTINTTINNYEVIATEDLSVNGNVVASGDASYNGALFVNEDASLNANLAVGIDIEIGGFVNQF